MNEELCIELARGLVWMALGLVTLMALGVI